jgi:hypothetical protein
VLSLAGTLALTLAVDPRRERGVLPSAIDVTSLLLPHADGTPTPGAAPSPTLVTCTLPASADGTPGAAAAATAASSRAVLPAAAGGTFFDRGGRRSVQLHPGHAVLHTSAHSSSSSSSSKGAWQRHGHSSSWHTSDDTVAAADNERRLVLPRGHAAPGEQLALPSSQGSALPQLHTTLSQRVAVGGDSGSLHAHKQQQHQQQQHGGAEPRGLGLPSRASQQQQQQHRQRSGSSSRSRSSSPHKPLLRGEQGKAKFRRRGVVADVCWMLRIKTFQVGGV